MNIERADIWLVNLNPTRGAEIRKTRPVVVISSNVLGILPIRLVAPITGWKNYFEQNIWHVKLEPSPMNGLSKTSAVDVLQIRGIDTSRFIERMGKVSEDELDNILKAVVAVIEIPPF